MDTNQQIAEILKEADAYYARKRVVALTKEYRKAEPKLSNLECYQLAWDAELALIEIKDDMDGQKV